MKPSDVERLFEQSVQALQSEGLLGPARAAYARALFAATDVLIPGGHPRPGPAFTLFAPQMQRGQPAPERAALCLPPYKDAAYERYIACHELGHLLSVSPLEPLSRETFLRRWGVCRTVYRRDGDSFREITDDRCARENEQLDECLACWLYTRFEGQPPGPCVQSWRGPFAEMDQDRVIAAYLAHRLPE